jgi:hypothetical protein
MGDFIIITGIVIYLIGWAASVRLAFKESTYLGFWVLIVPVVWLYFMFTRIKSTAKWTAVSLGGLLIIVLGAFIKQSSM